MHVSGWSTIGDLLGDLVAYRSLRPCDARLADFPVPGIPPRKIEPEYARAVADLLQRARRLDAPGTPIRRLIVVGDNAPTDGAAFENLRVLTGWEGIALIVDERSPAGDQSASARPARAAQGSAEADNGQLLLSRWSDLPEWAAIQGAVDEGTVVLLDIDKTLLGARGRNDAAIDAARTRAMRAAVAASLGDRVDDEVFETARQTFNRREFHGLTGDNQDYVAYLCLIASSGVWTTDELCRAIKSGEVRSIDQLVAAVDRAGGPAAERLRVAHQAIAERIHARDPTPFKDFRIREYIETIGQMNGGQDGDLEVRLHEEITLTGEVLDVARQWQACGALLFALSDKPDEAALPTPELSAQGYRPLHWTYARVVVSGQ